MEGPSRKYSVSLLNCRIESYGLTLDSRHEPEVVGHPDEYDPAAAKHIFRQGGH